MKALYNSLRIKYNENRDTVYNRIFEKLKTGFVYDSYFLYKFTRTNAELGSQNHYHMYTSYELSDTPAFDFFVQNYIQATFSPSGRSRDLEYSYSSTRRGSSLNYSLAANILFRKGTPSELAQAITVIDEITDKWDDKYLHSWPVNASNDSRTVIFTQALVKMLNTYHFEFEGYDALNITLDDNEWLEAAYNSGVDSTTVFVESFSTEVPFIPLFYRKAVVSVNPNISGVTDGNEVYSGVYNWKVDSNK
jgi:hypothetical protein